MEIVLGIDSLKLWSSEKKEFFLHDEIEGGLEKSHFNCALRDHLGESKICNERVKQMPPIL